MRTGRPQRTCTTGLSRWPQPCSRVGGSHVPSRLYTTSPATRELGCPEPLPKVLPPTPRGVPPAALPGQPLSGGRPADSTPHRASGTAAAVATATTTAASGSISFEVPPTELPLQPHAAVNNVVTALPRTGSGTPAGKGTEDPGIGGKDGAPVPSLEPFTLVRSLPLAGGKLDVVRWQGDRMLRIWTPPGFSMSDAAREPYPVVYLNDGQSLFEDSLSLSGNSWHAAETAAGLMNSGLLPPFVIIGIDHSGTMRSYDYLPYPPGDAEGYRKDAKDWPGGGVDAYLRAVLDEVVPYAERAYGVSPDPSLRGFGGSSFGGICALCCMLRHPGVFGSFLVESPSLWFGEEKLLRQDLPAFGGPWPDRVFLAMGTKEYSGIRPKPEPAFDDKLVSYTHDLAALLEQRGLSRGSRLEVVVDEGATHTETAWAQRLAEALRFLGLQWWYPLMARRRDQLYFTVPRKLHAGQQALLFFNQARSAVLADRPRASLKMAYGFNVDWSVSGGQADLQPAAGLALLQQQTEQQQQRATSTPPAPASSSAYTPSTPSTSTALAATISPAPPPDTNVAASEASAPSSSSSSSVPCAASNAPSDQAAAMPPHPTLVAEPNGEAPASSSDTEAKAPAHGPGSFTGYDPAEGSHWLQAAFTVPPEAYELHLAFHDGPGGTWDNNAGSNFYVRVKMDMTAAQRSHTVEQAILEGPSWGNVQDIAHKRSGSMYFTTPEVLVAGEPAVLYVNRCRVRGLETNPNLRVHLGFNGWQLGGQEACMKPTSLWRGEHIDWWSTTMTVPPEATDLSFVLTDGHGTWDNNHGNNYISPVKQARVAAGVTGAEPRDVESVESMPHAAGTLYIVTLTKRKGPKSATRANKWTEEKRMRVWAPPGFDAANPPPGGYPVLFMQDGQNMFEDWLAHQGVSWRVGYTASELITRGELPPFLVVAVDSAGAMRSLNYLPYPPGTGAGGFRGDAERWPGGGLEAYMTRLVEEIMPLVQRRFSASSDPAKVAFGGGSFAGVAALYAAMHYPHVFGSVLVESPSLWIAEGRFLQDMRMHRGMLPERLFLGCGTREYSATRDHDRDDMDALLLGYCHEAASILQSQGLRGSRLRFLVEEGAGHHELAWQWRLTGAMRFLFNAWWDE